MEKIKLFIQTKKGENLIILLIIIFVGVSSFLLGRMSVESKNSAFNIIYPDGSTYKEGNINNTQKSQISPKIEQSNNNTNPVINGNFFASKRGHKYYPLGCSAGKTIKDENRIWFDTREEAMASGFELSSSCD